MTGAIRRMVIIASALAAMLVVAAPASAQRQGRGGYLEERQAELTRLRDQLIAIGNNLERAMGEEDGLCDLTAYRAGIRALMDLAARTENLARSYDPSPGSGVLSTSQVLEAIRSRLAYWRERQADCVRRARPVTTGGRRPREAPPSLGPILGPLTARYNSISGSIGQAAADCDIRGLERAIRLLEGLLAEVRPLPEAARTAGSSSEVDPAAAERLEASIRASLERARRELQDCEYDEAERERIRERIRAAIANPPSPPASPAPGPSAPSSPTDDDDDPPFPDDEAPAAPAAPPPPPSITDRAAALLDQARAAPRTCADTALNAIVQQLEALLAEVGAVVRRYERYTNEWEAAVLAREAVRDALRDARALRGDCPEDASGNGLRFDVVPNYGGYALPPTGIGVTRAGPPGAAPELPAATTPENVRQYGLDLGLSIDRGSVLAHGFYYEGSETRPFARPAVGGTDTGRVNGALSPGGSSGVIGGFALDGTVASEGLAYGARLEIRVAETGDAPAPTGGTFAELHLYGEATRNESDYRGVVNGVILGGFTFSQERDQEIDETRIGAGLAGAITFTLGNGVTIVFDGSAGGYYRDTSLGSVERNRCSFCPVVDRDFTLTIQDDDNGFGVRGALGAGVSYDLSPRVSVGLRGAVDYWSSVGRVFNPNSGDQVFFERLTTGLRTDDAWRWRIGAGLIVRFPGR